MTSLFQSLVIKIIAFGTQPAELEDRDREQNEALITQGKMVSKILHHLNTNLWGWMGIKVLKELVVVLAKPLLIVHQQSWLSREVTADWNYQIHV